MKKSGQPKELVSTTLTVAIATMVIGGLASTLCFAGPETAAPPSQNNAASSQTNSPSTNAAPAEAQITGAELYSMHCNRCHPDRFPTERTAAQWKTIMLHMQVRANLPVGQSKLILKYLQENSGR